MTTRKRDDVANQVRALSAKLEAGDELPSEHELANQIGASRSTVHLALEELAREGFVQGRQGGRYVLLNRAPLTRDPWTPGAEQVDARRVYFQYADADTATKLGGLGTNAEIVVREETLSIDEQPTQLSIARFPRSLVRGTPLEQDMPADPEAELERAGHTIHNVADTVTPRLLTRDEIDALRAPKGSLGLHVERRITSDTGRLLAVSTIILVDRYASVYERPPAERRSGDH